MQYGSKEAYLTSSTAMPSSSTPLAQGQRVRDRQRLERGAPRARGYTTRSMPSVTRDTPRSGTPALLRVPKSQHGESTSSYCD